MDGDLLKELHELKSATLDKIHGLKKKISERATNGTDSISTSKLPPPSTSLEQTESMLTHEFRKLLMAIFFETNFAYFGIEVSAMATDQHQQRRPRRRTAESIATDQEVQREVMSGSPTQRDLEEDDDDDDDTPDSGDTILFPCYDEEGDNGEIRLWHTMDWTTDTNAPGNNYDADENRRKTMTTTTPNKRRRFSETTVTGKRRRRRRNDDHCHDAEDRLFAEYYSSPRMDPNGRPALSANARSLRRTELMTMVNNFLAGFGEQPVKKRDPIWNQWFLCEYLGLSPSEKNSGKALSVIDKIPIGREATRKVHDAMFSRPNNNNNNNNPRTTRSSSPSAAPALSFIQPPPTGGVIPVTPWIVGNCI